MDTDLVWSGGYRKVSTMKWYGTLIEEGVVDYSVHGMAVLKPVVRQLLVYDNYNGTYVGAIRMTNTGCSNPANDGSDTRIATISVIQSRQSVSVSFVRGTETVTINGMLTQADNVDALMAPPTRARVTPATLSWLKLTGNTPSGRLASAQPAPAPAAR
jgi:hypothetical protein